MNLKLLLFFLFTTICLAQNPNDCDFALAICGNSSIQLDPTGVGFDEFSLPGNTAPPCYTFNNNTIWLKFEIESDGVFTFDLIPINGTDDYDFAIYGPDATCTNLGQSIRCSSTNPQNANVPADTGLNLTETDVNEGPGEDGNGYLMYIDASAGDVYYLLIDRAHGSEGFELFYTGEAQLPNTVVANPIAGVAQCDTDGMPDGSTEFDLDGLIPAIQGTQVGTTVTFHESINDANIGINNLTSPYTNTSNPQTIYARIENAEGCADFTDFIIEIGNPALMNPEPVIVCSNSASDIYILDTIIPEVIADPTGYSITYHSTQNDADTDSNPIGPNITLTTTVQTIFVRVTDATDSLCFSTTSFTARLAPIVPATQASDIHVCDDDFDESVTYNVSDKDLEVLNGLSPNLFDVRYYASEVDRASNMNGINGNYTTVMNPQTIFISLYEIATACFDYTEFTITVDPIPVPVFDQESYSYCLNTDPIEIAVQAGFDFYEWSTGEAGPNLNSIAVSAAGTYTVTVTNEFNCTGAASVVVDASDFATIIDLVVKDFSGTKNSITVLVEGIGDYEYSLDSEYFYQDSNVFTGVFNGYHTVYVRDKNGCGVVSQQVLVLDYPHFFTPNEDPYNNRWKIIGMNEFPDTKIYIFNRYGKLLKQILPNDDGWDGTNLKGNPLPSNDYWFTIAFKNGRTFKGHFTLKR